LKVLFTSHRFYPDLGGIESISATLAHTFSSRGHSVRLVTRSAGDAHLDRLQYPFKILRNPSCRELIASYHWADIIFQNNLEVRRLWPQLLFRKPLVIGLQTWIRSVDGRRSVLSRVKLSILYFASAVVACSNAVRADSFPNASVIGNPYDDKLFQVYPDIPRQQAIVFLGRLVSDKGVDLLLRAYSCLKRPDWPITIIGSGPEYESLRALAHHLGISQSVRFTGSLQGAPLSNVLNTHEIMVVPSLWHEPFGIVALEGQASGCLVLAADGGGLPDAVGPGGLLFRCGDQADLTAKLRLLIEDTALRSRLRAKATAHLAHFQPEVVGAQYLEILERVHDETLF
jgi:glycosyltransferase involved in cell wall biosynthesis